MPEYLHPGVYIEEIERGPRPIEGVPTSTAAFLGETERGPIRPRFVTSYTDYKRWFGGTFKDARYMPNAVSGFFENGGKRLYVCRIVGNNSTTASKVLGDFTVHAVGPGQCGTRVWIKIENGSTKNAQGETGFRLKIAYWKSVPQNFQPYDPFDLGNRYNGLPRPQQAEDYDDLQVDPNSSDYYEKRLIDSTTSQPVSALAVIERTTPDSTGKPPNTAPEGVLLDQNGTDDSTPLGDDDFKGGVVDSRTELQGLLALELDPYRDVSLVYAPKPFDNAIPVEKAVIDHCERMRFRFAVVDSSVNSNPSDLDPRTSLQDTTYAGFYSPWIVTTDPETGARITVPPGGHVLGIYARSDSERGVFKAPANELIRGVLDLRFDINESTQDLMNPRGVNAIRKFPGRGIRVWGARTLSSNGLWKYVSVRRLFIFLERSIYENTQWVVFEPNDDRLWARVVDTIRLFLRAQWRLGALFGRTEQEAFFITCDRTTMSQDDILNGRLICEIGIAPVRPAEFVIFRIFQNTSEAQR